MEQTLRNAFSSPDPKVRKAAEKDLLDADACYDNCMGLIALAGPHAPRNDIANLALMALCKVVARCKGYARMEADKRKELRGLLLAFLPLQGWHSGSRGCDQVCTLLLSAMAVEAEVCLLARAKGQKDKPAAARAPAARRDDSDDDEGDDDDDVNDDDNAAAPPVLLTDFWPEAAAHLIEAVIKPAQAEPEDGKLPFADRRPGPRSREDAVATAAALLDGASTCTFAHGKYTVLLALACGEKLAQGVEAPGGRAENLTLFSRLLNAALSLDNSSPGHWMSSVWQAYRVHAISNAVDALRKGAGACGLSDPEDDEEEEDDDDEDNEDGGHDGGEDSEGEDAEGDEEGRPRKRGGRKSLTSLAAADASEDVLIKEEAAKASVAMGREVVIPAIHSLFAQWRAGIERALSLCVNAVVAGQHRWLADVFDLMSAVASLLVEMGPSLAIPLKAVKRGRGGARPAAKKGHSRGADEDDSDAEAGEDSNSAGFVGVLGFAWPGAEDDDDDDDDDDKEGTAAVTALHVLRAFLNAHKKLSAVDKGFAFDEVATLGALLASDYGGGGDEDEDEDDDNGGAGEEASYRLALAQDKKLVDALFRLALKQLQEAPQRRREDLRHAVAANGGPAGAIAALEAVIDDGCDDSSKWSQAYERAWQRDVPPNEMGAEEFNAGMRSTDERTVRTYAFTYRLLSTLTAGIGVNAMMTSHVMPAVTRLLMPSAAGGEAEFTMRRAALQVLTAVVKGDKFKSLLKPSAAGAGGSKKPAVAYTFSMPAPSAPASACCSSSSSACCAPAASTSSSGAATKYSYPVTPARQVIELILPCLASDSLVVQHSAICLVTAMASQLLDPSFNSFDSEPPRVNAKGKGKGGGGGGGGCCDDDACGGGDSCGKAAKDSKKKKGKGKGDATVRLEVHSLLDAASDLLLFPLVELIGEGTAGKPRIRASAIACMQALFEEQYLRDYHVDGPHNEEMRGRLVAALLDVAEAKALPGQASGQELWWNRVASLGILSSLSSRVPKEMLLHYNRIKQLTMDFYGQALPKQQDEPSAKPTAASSAKLVALREAATMALQLWTCTFDCFKEHHDLDDHDHCHDGADGGKCGHDHKHDHHHHGHSHSPSPGSPSSIPLAMAAAGKDSADLKLALEVVSRLTTAAMEAFRAGDKGREAGAPQSHAASKLEAAALSVAQSCALSIQRILEAVAPAQAQAPASAEEAASGGTSISISDIFASCLPFILECGGIEAKPFKVRPAESFTGGEEDDDEEEDHDEEEDEDDDEAGIAGAMRRMAVGAGKDAKGDADDDAEDEAEDEAALEYARAVRESSEDVMAVYYRASSPSSSNATVVLRGTVKTSRVDGALASLSTLRMVLKTVVETSVPSSVEVLRQLFGSTPDVVTGDSDLPLLLRQLVCVVKQGCRAPAAAIREEAAACNYMLVEAARRWVEVDERERAAACKPSSSAYKDRYRPVLSYLVRALLPAMCDAVDLCTLTLVKGAGNKIVLGSEADEVAEDPSLLAADYSPVFCNESALVASGSIYPALFVFLDVLRGDSQSSFYHDEDKRDFSMQAAQARIAAAYGADLDLDDAKSCKVFESEDDGDEAYRAAVREAKEQWKARVGIGAAADVAASASSLPLPPRRPRAPFRDLITTAMATRVMRVFAAMSIACAARANEVITAWSRIYGGSRAAALAEMAMGGGGGGAGGGKKTKAGAGSAISDSITMRLMKMESLPGCLDEADKLGTVFNAFQESYTLACNNIMVSTQAFTTLLDLPASSGSDDGSSEDLAAVALTNAYRSFQASGLDRLLIRNAGATGGDSKGFSGQRGASASGLWKALAFSVLNDITAKRAVPSLRAATACWDEYVKDCLPIAIESCGTSELEVMARRSAAYTFGEIVRLNVCEGIMTREDAVVAAGKCLETVRAIVAATDPSAAATGAKGKKAAAGASSSAPFDPAEAFLRAYQNTEDGARDEASDDNVIGCLVRLCLSPFVRGDSKDEGGEGASFDFDTALKLCYSRMPLKADVEEGAIVHGLLARAMASKSPFCLGGKTGKLGVFLMSALARVLLKQKELDAEYEEKRASFLAATAASSSAAVNVAASGAGAGKAGAPKAKDADGSDDDDDSDEDMGGDSDDDDDDHESSEEEESDDDKGRRRRHMFEGGGDDDDEDDGGDDGSDEEPSASDFCVLYKRHSDLLGRTLARLATSSDPQEKAFVAAVFSALSPAERGALQKHGAAHAASIAKAK